MNIGCNHCIASIFLQEKIVANLTNSVEIERQFKLDTIVNRLIAKLNSVKMFQLIYMEDQPIENFSPRKYSQCVHEC